MTASFWEARFQADPFRRVARVCYLVAVAVVAGLSLMPQELLPHVDLWDKLQHLSVYAVVAVLAGAGFPHARSRWHAALSLVVIGCMLEIGQAFVPGRTSDVFDAVANTLGIGLGLTAATTIEHVLAFGARRWLISSRPDAS